MTGPGDPPRPALARALVLLHRYSRDLSGVAARALGDHVVENRDIQVFTAVSREGQRSPTQLGQQLSAPRSTISRSMNRLESAGLTERIPDPADGRGVLVVLTPRGRRRSADLAKRLAAYFADAEPLVKDLCTELGMPPSGIDQAGSVPPLEITAAMAAAGALFVEETLAVLAQYGIRETTDRSTLALVYLAGEQRPTALADVLGLRPSGVSGVLNRLEQSGLITRRHDLTPGDRRAVVVGLTPRGRAATEAALDVFSRHAADLARAVAMPYRD